MKDIMNVTKKIVLGVAVGFMANFSFAQSLQEGVASIDSHKYAKAKKNFEAMVAKTPSAENYFYLGNSYLSQSDPDFQKAEENFRKGLSLDGKSYLNKIGIATIKLGKGDKSAFSEIQNIVKDSREKDAEVLFRAGEALTLFEKTNNPDLAVDFINKAVEKSMKAGVPAHYYYSLGDAYRQKLSNSPQVAGNAMTAYDKALVVAKNKASVYTRMATLWMQAQRWQLAKEKLDQAIATDPSYAPAYKALAAYEMRYQQPAKATEALINYSKYADEDPYTQLEIAKMHYSNKDFVNSRNTLDKIFTLVEDPIKYKLRAYLEFANDNYSNAQTDLNSFMSKVSDKSRILIADKTLESLIAAGLAKNDKDPAKKAEALAIAQQKIALAKQQKDETLNWDAEISKIQGGASQAAADAGPTTPTIENLKKQHAANPKDANVLVNLGTAYMEAKNWNGAVVTWDKMISLAPTWAYSYYAKGSALHELNNDAAAELMYQKFIDTVLSQTPAEQEQQKVTMSYAYFLVANYNITKDLAKAKDYAAKAVQLNPTYQDAVNLYNKINK